MYLPSKGDIIWIDFDPSVGREIKKRRPAVVLSSYHYTAMTNLVLVSPITKGAKKLGAHGYTVSVETYGLEGAVNPLHLHTFDITERHATYISHMNNHDLARVLAIQQFIYQD